VSAGEAKVNLEIVDACRRGDRAAFRTLYDAYKDTVYSIALYTLHGDADLAADVTQQVFVKLMTSIHKFRGDSAFSTWLYRIVANACMDAHRRAKPRRFVTDATTLNALVQPGSQDRTLARAETSQTVRRALASLPEKLRLPILLRYFEQLSYEDIAVVLGCSIGTVASRLSRGHRLLAKTLAPLRDRGQVVE
jgi:RNA polymerase sigma-70 factor (ECF subfamily)